MSLGYRKPTAGAGTWIARLIRDGHRAEHRLGQADDAGAAPGALPYGAALTEALAWAARRAGANSERADRATEPLTVRTAVAAYVADRKARNPENGRDAETRLTKHLLAAKIADRPLADLTDADMAGWVRALDGIAPATVARLLNDTKAALHQAAETHHRLLPAGWRDMLARGLRRGAAAHAKAQPPAAAHQRPFLSLADVRALVAAAGEQDEDGDFSRLVAVLAQTGARFSQVVRLTVADVTEDRGNPARVRLMMPSSRKGRPGNSKATHYPVAIGADLLTLLRPAMAGRGGHEPLLTRWHHRQHAGDKETGRAPRWVKDRREPWHKAADMARPWARAVAAAGLPPSVTPYRLRDASIIRALTDGRLSVQHVAKLHDTSAAMIERHYASHIADAMTDAAHSAVVSIVSAPAVTLRAVG
ncbi:integrase [Muricoccus nepalensis]|uniref:integrase n=1 Tax=Muricoccus nepalensis TaxID=1854500 RepID=UPI00112E99AA|nr:integrase [Roseomonas nepalensis]